MRRIPDDTPWYSIKPMLMEYQYFIRILLLNKRKLMGPARSLCQEGLLEAVLPPWMAAPSLQGGIDGVFWKQSLLTETMLVFASCIRQFNPD